MKTPREFNLRLSQPWNPYRIMYVFFIKAYFDKDSYPSIPEADIEGWVEFHFSTPSEFTLLKTRFLGGNAYAKCSFTQNFPDGAKMFYPKGCLRIITIKDLLEPISLLD